MKKLKDDVLGHVNGGTAGYFASYRIVEDQCVDCAVCYAECPVEAIYMSGGHYRINQNECIECGVCKDLCPCDAIRENG